MHTGRTINVLMQTVSDIQVLEDAGLSIKSNVLPFPAAKIEVPPSAVVTFADAARDMFAAMPSWLKDGK